MRRVLLITHTGRHEAVQVSLRLIEALSLAGIEVRLPPKELAEVCAGTGEDAGRADGAIALDGSEDGFELIVAIGGDGTILRASEFAEQDSIPLLGMNLGHVGFLAEAESDAVESVVRAIIDSSYHVEERLVLRVSVLRKDKVCWESWALNEAAVSKREARGMIDVLLEVDNRPLSRWGCDGVVLATPTGSTAYTWSAGGPVVWPKVRAMLVTPLSAHALFARSLVVDPDGEVALEISASSPDTEVICDGQRSYTLEPADRLEVTASDRPMRFARLRDADFTDRLVAKFELPVHGWRGR